MKQLAIWLVIAAAALGGTSGAYHAYLSGAPRQVLVVVDGSHAMRSALEQVRGELDRLDDARYSRFALYTEKGRVHAWAERFDSSRLRAYGPRRLEEVFAGDPGPEFGDADTVILFTNAPPAATSGAPAGWTVRSPG